MTGRGNDIPNQSSRFIIQKNDGAFFVQNPSALSFVLIQGQQYIIPVSNQLVGSLMQAAPSVSQTSFFLNPSQLQSNSEEKIDLADDLQEFPPALDKVDDEEDPDENKETTIGFPCEKAFLKEADDFKKSVNIDGVVFHNIDGFAIEESERPLSPLSYSFGKQKGKGIKDSVSSQKFDDLLKKERRKLADSEAFDSSSKMGKSDCEKEKSKTGRGNELTQLLSMDFGPKAGQRILQDTKRRSFNERYDEDGSEKRKFSRNREHSEDSSSFRSSSRDCSELDYSISVRHTRRKRLSSDSKKIPEPEPPKKVSSDYCKEDPNVFKTESNTVNSDFDDVDVSVPTRSRYVDGIKSETDEEEMQDYDDEIDEDTEDEEYNAIEDEHESEGYEDEGEEEEYEEYEEEKILPFTELESPLSSDFKDALLATEKLEELENWCHINGSEQDVVSNPWEIELTPKLGRYYRFEFTSSPKLDDSTEGLIPNETKCLNCSKTGTSKCFPQYCSIVCRQFFIKENGDQYSLAGLPMSEDDLKRDFRMNRIMKIQSNITELDDELEYVEELDTSQVVLCGFCDLKKMAPVVDKLPISDKKKGAENVKSITNSCGTELIENTSELPLFETKEELDLDDNVDVDTIQERQLAQKCVEKLNSIHPYNWTVHETSTWVFNTTGSRELADSFEKEAIDASVLFSLSSREMRESPFKLKFGFARKIEVAIEKCCSYWMIQNRLESCEDIPLTKDVNQLTVDDLYRMVFQRTKDKKLASRIRDEEIDGFILQISTWEELRTTCVTEDSTKLGVQWKIDRIEKLFNYLKSKCVK